MSKRLCSKQETQETPAFVLIRGEVESWEAGDLLREGGKNNVKNQQNWSAKNSNSELGANLLKARF